jgi:hypothetical protein
MFKHLSPNSSILEIIIILFINLLTLYFNISYNEWNINFYITDFFLILNIIFILFRIIYFYTKNKYIKKSIRYVHSFILKYIFIYPITLFSKISFYINRVFNYIKINLNKGFIWYDNNDEIKALNLINITYDENLKFYNLDFENSQLYTKDMLMRALWKGFIDTELYKKEGLKSVITTIFSEEKEYFIHKNIIINNETSIDQYLSKIESSIKKLYDSGYEFSTFPIIRIKLFILENKKIGIKKSNLSPIYIQRRSFYNSSLINKNVNLNSIKPLKSPPIFKELKGKLICAMDIETINLNNNQIPIAITFSYYDINNNLQTIFKLIDYNLINRIEDSTIHNLINKLWIDLFDELSKINSIKNSIIYCHNLGHFDGYFIYKAILNLPNIDLTKVSCIIDDKHKFIGIEAIINNQKFIWKDSYRLFPLSLEELCKMFNITGKFGKYNLLFNKIDLFNNSELLTQFIEYAKQDSVALLNVLLKAQSIYISNHKIDIATIWSTASLSLKIFRQNFQKHDIPILSKYLDNKIRESYFGGSTDYIRKYGENLHYYDVNSLYPFAMCNPMPLEYLGEFEGFNLDLNDPDTFGFIEAKITAPKGIEIPLLPLKYKGMTVHPNGTWIGTYFSEELKTVAKYGYKIQILKLYKFSKVDLFTKYIEFFYNIKKNSTGSLRFIAKMHLNTLYGYFGRKLLMIETKNIFNKDLENYITKYSIFSIITINEKISTLLMSSNLDYDLVNELNNVLKIDIVSPFRKVQSNVALASAVTSYARIAMLKYKLIPGIKIFYFDTDSIFTDKPLPNYLIGDDLGLMKDELNGAFIKKAYFLGIKKYGYIDSNNVTHSVFSGVERNSLTWNEIESIANGNIIHKTVSNRFYKDFKSLSIAINISKLSIKFDTFKILKHNIYQPIKINFSLRNKFSFYERLILTRIKIFIRKFKHLIEN